MPAVPWAEAYVALRRTQGSGLCSFLTTCLWALLCPPSLCLSLWGPQGRRVPHTGPGASLAQGGLQDSGSVAPSRQAKQVPLWPLSQAQPALLLRILTGETQVDQQGPRQTAHTCCTGVQTLRGN